MHTHTSILNKAYGKALALRQEGVILVNPSFPTIWPAVSLIPVVFLEHLHIVLLFSKQIWVSSHSLLCYTPLHAQILNSDSPCSKKALLVPHAKLMI